MALTMPGLELDQIAHSISEGGQDKAVLAPFRAKQDSVFEEGVRRLSLLLTPEQKAIYDQMRRERAQRTERR